MRSCGTCISCCYNPKIPELKKEERVLCQNCSGSNCLVYETRPNDCRTFLCSWMQGELYENQRPDMCGVMIENHGPFRFAMCEGDEWKEMSQTFNVYTKHGIPVVIGTKKETFVMIPEEMTRSQVETMVQGVMNGRS